MIFYATKQTIDRYKIKMSNEMSPLFKETSNMIIERETNDPLLEWGLKLFYFDRRKCIQAMNFASKLTIFIFDVKVDDIYEIGNTIAIYLLDLYRDDKNMITLLNKLFSDSPICVFSKLTNRSIISSLNRNQSDYALDGYRFFEYIENGILKTKEINHDVNFNWFVTLRVSNKPEYILPGEQFKTLLQNRYLKNIKN